MATRAERLSREDWITKALDTLSEQGLGAIRVEPLARALGVTKGSFYWHFADHQALLDAMIESWLRSSRERMTIVANHDPDPAKRLHFLLHVVSEGGCARFDLAVRAWAMHDGSVLQRALELDRERFAMVTGMFREMGFSELDARTRTRIVSANILGDQAIIETNTDEERRHTVETIFKMVTARPA